MKNERHIKRILRALSHYATFFLLVAFVITCCMTLFLNVLSDNLHIEFTDENIADAAKLTFWNVFPKSAWTKSLGASAPPSSNPRTHRTE